MKTKPKYEFYVPQYNFNAKKIEMWNIFDNIHVYNNVVKLTRDHIKNGTPYEEYKEELRKIIQWQEWGRCEYEVLIGGWPPTDELEKWDAYGMALPNIDLIAQMCIERTK